MTPLEQALVDLVEEFEMAASAAEDGGTAHGFSEAAHKLENVLIHECVIEGKV